MSDTEDYIPLKKTKEATTESRMEFRNTFGENIFRNKYALSATQTWAEKAHDIVKDVTSNLFQKEHQEALEGYIRELKFIPGGRYVYYAGRQARFYNNCYLLRGEEDTREEWGRLLKRASDCLMSGGGIGVVLKYTLLHNAE